MSRGTSCGFFCRKRILSNLDNNWNIISTLANFSWQAWQNWILSVHGNFLNEFDSAKKNFFFHGFRTSGETNETFWRNIFSRIVKTASSGSGETLWLNTFLEEPNFYYHFGTLREKSVSFLTKDFQQGFKSRLLRVQENLLKSIFRRNYFLKLIWPLGEKNPTSSKRSRQCCKYFILNAQVAFLWKILTKLSKLQ